MRAFRRRTGGRATIRERTCLPPGSAGPCARGDHGLAPPGELYSRGLRRHSRSGWRKRLGLERRGPAGRQRLACRLDAAWRAGALLRRHAAGLSRARAPQGRRPRSPRGPGSAPCLRRGGAQWPGAGAALAGGRPGHGCRGPPFGDTPRLPVRYRFRRAAAFGPRRARRHGARSLRPHQRTREPRTADRGLCRR